MNWSWKAVASEEWAICKRWVAAGWILIFNYQITQLPNYRF
jgi:hypothetical protein